MASSLFAQFATNRKAEVEGVPVTFGNVNEDGTVPTFRLARMGKSNKRYQKMIEAETKPHIHAIRSNNLAPELDEAITLRVFCASVLVGWENLIVPEVFDASAHTIAGPVREADGVRLSYVPFSAENAEKLMKALPELYANLKEQAQGMAIFRAEELAADSKS